MAVKHTLEAAAGVTRVEASEPTPVSWCRCCGVSATTMSSQSVITVSFRTSSRSRVGFNVLPNIAHIGDDFYGSDNPTNSVKALKDNSWSVHQIKGQSHQAKPSTR